MTDLADIATLAARVVAAAVAWYEETDRGPQLVERENGIYQAVEAFRAACGPVPLTWGQVPAGWEVRAPDGAWYRVTDTYRKNGGIGQQFVGLEGIGHWNRDPDGPVIARPGVPDYTDVAIAALGYPQVLEDER